MKKIEMNGYLPRLVVATLGVFASSALAGDSLIVTQEAKLRPLPLTMFDDFGYAVDLDGSFLAASGIGWSAGEDDGVVYVFERKGADWTTFQELYSPNSQGKKFGFALALRGDHLLVVEENINAPLPTKVYSYVRSGSGTFAYEGEVDTPQIAGGSSGASVDVDGTTALVSVATNGSGWARIFVRGAQGWEPQGDLVPEPGVANDWFGRAGALDGITAVVGAPQDATAGPDAGAVHVFTHNGAQWVHRTRILPPPGASLRFGWSVDLGDGTLAVGAPVRSSLDSGTTYMYEGSGAQWTLVATLKSEAPMDGDCFGTCISLDDDMLLVGAPSVVKVAGSASLFTRRESVWSEAATFVLEGAEAGLEDRFGWDVDLEAQNERFLVSAPGVYVNEGEVVVYGFEDVVESYCFGDGTGTDCPCANPGSATSGCVNSTGVGAVLDPYGSESVSDDDLAFDAFHLRPNQPVLLFVGTQTVNGGAGVVFGDGLRCAGGGVVRLGTVNANANGEASWGPGLSGSGGWAAGDSRAFQCWYRDPGGPCGSGFNLSQGLRATFVP